MQHLLFRRPHFQVCKPLTRFQVEKNTIKEELETVRPLHCTALVKWG